MLSAVSGPVEAEPLGGRCPVHAPEASQEIAFDAAQVSVEATPSGTVVGLALNAISGAPEPPVPPCPPSTAPDAPQPEPQPVANKLTARTIVRLIRVPMADPPLTPHGRYHTTLSLDRRRPRGKPNRLDVDKQSQAAIYISPKRTRIRMQLGLRCHARRLHNGW